MTVDKQKTFAWLQNRGLTRDILIKAKISTDSFGRIVIPVISKEGEVLFNKYRRNPFAPQDSGPKYTYDAGSKSTLYGLNLINEGESLIICEGELDALLLNRHGINAVCSTGGAGTFKDEWFDLLKGYKIYLCFDNDEAGKKGMERIATKNPDVLIFPFPPDMPEHADVTDFIKEYGPEAFINKLKYSFSYKPPVESQPTPVRSGPTEKGDDLVRAKSVPLIDHVESKLKKNTKGWVGKCPFHNENTASFQIFKDNRYYCFGCREEGDVVDYIMKTKNLEFKDAIKYLLN